MNQQSAESTISTCYHCDKQLDLSFIKNENLKFHRSCIKCITCKKSLEKRDYCMIKKGKIYCDLHCLKVGVRVPKNSHCHTCGERLNGNTRVVKVRGNVYHPKCLQCTECGVRLKPRHPYGIENDKIVCLDHYTLKPRKPINRTMIDSKQKISLLAKYRINKFPSSSQREQIGQELNLNPYVVKVWFQNHRARKDHSLKNRIKDEEDFEEY